MTAPLRQSAPARHGRDPQPAPTRASDAAAIRAHVAERLAEIERYPDPAVWIHRAPVEAVRSQVESAVGRRDAGADVPLIGLTFAVKDNIDVAGMPTTAACPDFAYTPDRSAVVVQRLIDAGAVVLGKTNLDQFATGLVGTRSPYGACRNVFDARYISGGSSSGSAVAVAAGLADFALGTDTAGSGRVPAAFNNIIGVKPSRGLLSTTGVVPACRSLDCVSIFAGGMEMAERVFAAARAFDPGDVYARSYDDLRANPVLAASGPLRVGILADADLEFFGDTEGDWLYRAAIRRAEDVGGMTVAIDFAPFRDAARLLYEGPRVAERLAAIRPFFERSAGSLLPVTREIIAAAAKYDAVGAYEAEYRLRALARAAENELRKADVLLLPTAPTIYTVEQVQANPVALNRNLGYYTNFVNLLDLCAVAVPAGFASNGLPFGVTFMAPAGADEGLLGVAERFVAMAPATIGGVE